MSKTGHFNTVSSPEQIAISARSIQVVRFRRLALRMLDTISWFPSSPVGGALLNSLGQNLRFAVRQLVRNRAFTVTVVVTLALSIGANTAIFSIVNALMLKSLPYPQPDRMGTLFQRNQGPNPTDEPRWIDGTQWEQLRDNVPVAHLRCLRRPCRRCKSPGRFANRLRPCWPRFSALLRRAWHPACRRPRLLRR